MNETQQLKHRLAMVLDDITVIRQHIYTQNISRCFEEPTPIADECWTHLNNIEIACDLNSEESLSWKRFNQSENKETMTKLDLQSLDRNYFWVERPKAVIQELQDNFKSVEDVTYLNDETPSVLINGIVKMYLPNSVRQNEMENNQYTIVIDEDESFEGAEFFMTDRLDHAIDKIAELLETAKPLKSLIIRLTEEANELIELGNSCEKSKGHGIKSALHSLQQIIDKNETLKSL